MLNLNEVQFIIGSFGPKMLLLYMQKETLETQSVWLQNKVCINLSCSFGGGIE